MMRQLGLWLRLALLVGWLILLTPLHLLLDRGARPRRVARLFLKGTAALLGLRFSLAGARVREPVLLVANHVSWADIPVFGAALDAGFVAKGDIGEWPLLGWLARRHGTLFVDRARRIAAGKQSGAITERLADGDSIILFAEGTTGDGVSLLPFKSALFAAVEGRDVLVQPVSLLWTHVGGRLVTDASRPLIAWSDDRPFTAHAARLIRAGGAEARILLHSPVRANAFAGRRELAQFCRDRIASGLDAMARGRHKPA